MSSTKITLFEIPTALPNNKPVSPFSATVRCALNYKKLAFKTELIPLRNFQSEIAKLGAKPTTTFPDGTPKYTSPTIIDSTSGTPVILSDSITILEYLESTYPDPARPIFTSIAVDKLAQAAIMDMYLPVMTRLDLRANLATVTEADRPTWMTRYLGPGTENKNIDDLEVLSKDSEEYKQLLKKGEENFGKLSGFLGAGKAWFGGDKPVYIDFFLLAMLSMMKDVWKKEWEEVFSKAEGGRFAQFLEAGQEYLKFTPPSA